MQAPTDRIDMGTLTWDLEVGGGTELTSCFCDWFSGKQGQADGSSGTQLPPRESEGSWQLQ